MRGQKTQPPIHISRAQPCPPLPYCSFGHMSSQHLNTWTNCLSFFACSRHTTPAPAARQTNFPDLHLTLARIWRVYQTMRSRDHEGLLLLLLMILMSMVSIMTSILMWQLPELSTASVLVLVSSPVAVCVDASAGYSWAREVGRQALDSETASMLCTHAHQEPPVNLNKGCT